ncbi:MAG: inositol monophosphatase family protein [Candidatus Eisenbacteria bacterium]
MRDETRVAADAARRAGAELRRCFEKPLDVAHKNRRELVTEMDLASEEIVLSAIRAEFPADPIVAEEGSPGEVGADGAARPSRVWIVDPLDGTNNYAHGYPFFSVAVALEERGLPVVGVVYDPLRDELFAAETGGGATLNGAPIRVSDSDSLSDSIVATGFPYDRTETSDNNLANLNRFILSARGIRRGGSAELDLVYVACGRLDGFWELGLKIWDVSAGGVIVQEAGGRVANFRSETWDHRRGDVVASNGLIQDEMQTLIG